MAAHNPWISSLSGLWLRAGLTAERILPTERGCASRACAPAGTPVTATRQAHMCKPETVPNARRRPGSSPPAPSRARSRATAPPARPAEARSSHASRSQPPRPRVTQRAVAVLLVALLFALILVVFVALFRALGHPAWGWGMGAAFCLFMVYGFVRDQRRRKARS